MLRVKLTLTLQHTNLFRFQINESKQDLWRLIMLSSIFLAIWLYVTLTHITDLQYDEEYGEQAFENCVLAQGFYPHL